MHISKIAYVDFYSLFPYLDVQEGVIQDQPPSHYSGPFTPNWHPMEASTSGECKIACTATFFLIYGSYLSCSLT